MAGLVVPLVVFVLLVVLVLSVVFMREIRNTWRRFKANFVVKREVPPPDRFDDQLRKYLERNRYGR